MPLYPATIGIILAGGLSRRMGGKNKAEQLLGGELILARIERRLAAQCASIVINSNADTGKFAHLNRPVISDLYPDFRGPLAGILAGMDWVAQHTPETEWVVSIAVDTPFFPDDFVSRLHQERHKKQTRIATACSGQREHPVNALWHISLRDDLRQTVSKTTNGRVMDWINRYPRAITIWETDPVDPFLNINTLDELDQAQGIIQHKANESRC